MAKRKPLTQARQRALAEYRKERNRIYSFVRSAEKRGYRFETGAIPKAVSQLSDTPTTSIKALTRYLKSQTAKQLYKKATALSASGNIVTGVSRLREERHERGLKASRTRMSKTQRQREFDSIVKQKEGVRKEAQDRLSRESIGFMNPPVEPEGLYEDIEYNTSYEDYEESNEYLSDLSELDRLQSQHKSQEEQHREREQREWEEYRRKQDEEARRKLLEEAEAQRMFSLGETTYNKIRSMIDDVSQTYWQAGMDLMSEFNEQIAEYGRESVLKAIAQAPQDAIESAEIALRYNPGDNRHDKAIIELRQIITGEIASAEEIKNLQEKIDRDSYTNEPE